MEFVTKLEQNLFTICMKTQKTPNSQSDLKKEKQYKQPGSPAWGSTTNRQ